MALVVDEYGGITGLISMEDLMECIFGDIPSPSDILFWVFGEIVPKSIFQQRADTITPRAIFFLRFCSYLFYPILVVFSFLACLLGRLVGGKNKEQNPFTLREEIQTMMQMSANEGDIEPIEQDMIRRLFN